MSDSRSTGGSRLAAAEPGETRNPLARPVAARSFLRVADWRPALRYESDEPFTPELTLEELNSFLLTTGFEGVDTPGTMEGRIAADIPSPTPEPVAFLKPIERPILEVKPSSAPIAVYDAIEFLDYEDEDDFVVGGHYEPEPELPVLTEPFAIQSVQPAAPAKAKMQPGIGSLPLPDAMPELPEFTLPTARARIVRGPNPNAPKPKPVGPPAAMAVQVKPVTTVQVKAEPGIKATPVTSKPPGPPPTVKVTPAVMQRPAAAAATAAAPVMKSEPTVAEPERPEPARPDREKRPAAKVPTPRGNAVPVDEVIEEAPPPPPKLKMVPIRKPAAETPINVPMLGLTASAESNGNKTKIAIAAAVVVALASGGYFLSSGGKAAPSANAATASTGGVKTPMVIGGGWTTTWGAEASVNKGKQISIYRPSMTVPDYRLEFRGQIERKAMGWIFRAANPKNYYVMKLETIKPGINPIVALMKYAVIDGKETTRTQVMLPFEVKLDTVYQVRLDVSGSKFSTYIQDKLVDYWVDDRVKVGGTGFYSENGERAGIKSSQVSYLK